MMWIRGILHRDHGLRMKRMKTIENYAGFLQFLRGSLCHIPEINNQMAENHRISLVQHCICTQAEVYSRVMRDDAQASLSRLLLPTKTQSLQPSLVHVCALDNASFSPGATSSQSRHPTRRLRLLSSTMTTFIN
jgi:hypothetical protein